jgi:DNA repair photolyase
MKSSLVHGEAGGEFIDVKTDAPELLAGELRKKRIGRVRLCGVCDAYQLLGKKCELTKRRIGTVGENGWPVTIHSQSPLVARALNS